MAKKKFIVKVQLSIGGDLTPRALVYNKDRSIQKQFLVTHGLQSAMAGRIVAYFYASMRGDNVSLDADAPEQSW